MHLESEITAHNRAQRDYYERRRPAENRRVQPRASRYVANHLQKLIAFADLKPGEKILDAGCGMGKYTLPLAERGFDVEGLDLSPVLLASLKAAGGDTLGVETHCADLLRPPAALAGRYDVVSGFFMLHHLLDLGAAFAGTRRLLRPRGRVAFLDVNPFCPLYYLQITLAPSLRWSAERGILKLTPRRLEQELFDAGFTEIRMKTFGILPPLLRNLPPGAVCENAFDTLPLGGSIAAFRLIAAVRA